MLLQEPDVFAVCLCVCRKMNGTPCIATRPCLDTMTNFGCPYYSLSHQLLYFMVAKMVRSRFITFVIQHKQIISKIQVIKTKKR